MRSLLVLVVALLALGGNAPAHSGPRDDVKAGLAALDRGDWANSVRLISLAIDSGQLSPAQLVPAYAGRGIAYYQLDQDALALAEMTRAIELIPGSGYHDEDAAFVYSNRASVYITMGNLHAALRDCEQALRLNSKDKIALYNRARVLERLGQRDAAIRDYRAVLSLDPGYDDAKAAIKRLGQ